MSKVVTAAVTASANVCNSGNNNNSFNSASSSILNSQEQRQQYHQAHPHPTSSSTSDNVLVPLPLAHTPPPGCSHSNYPLKDITYPHPHDVLCGRGEQLLHCFRRRRMENAKNQSFDSNENYLFFCVFSNQLVFLLSNITTTYVRRRPIQHASGQCPVANARGDKQGAVRFSSQKTKDVIVSVHCECRAESESNGTLSPKARIE